MQILDDCFDLAQKIREKNADISDLENCVMSPKIQTITDMPKGGGAQTNALDNYLIKLEKERRLRDKLVNKLKKNWVYVSWLFEVSGIDDIETLKLMRKRFYLGLPWKKCAKDMKNEFPNSNWNSNKCFRVYSSVLCKLDKIKK